MIRKSLTLTIVLLAAYFVGVYVFKPEPVTCEISKINIAIAQKFLYEDSIKCKDVIIGTSLSDKLRNDTMLPSDVYLLTFLGQHIFDGLEVLKHAKVYPKNVFIETNSILNEWDRQLGEYLYQSPGYYLRKRLIILRIGYEPASICSQPFKKLITPFTDKFSQRVFSRALKLLNAHKPQKIDEQFYNEKLKVRFNNINDSFAVVRFTLLKKEIDRLIKGGSNVFFFTMPVSENMKQTKMVQTSKKYYTLYFPQSEYNYSMKCNDSDFKTLDGLHLDDSSARSYAAFFRSELTKRRNSALK